MVVCVVCAFGASTGSCAGGGERLRCTLHAEFGIKHVLLFWHHCARVTGCKQIMAADEYRKWQFGDTSSIILGLFAHVGLQIILSFPIKHVRLNVACLRSA